MTEEEIRAADVVLSQLVYGDPIIWRKELFKIWLTNERVKHNVSHRISTYCQRI